jgi:adenine-specific DNA methylase
MKSERFGKVMDLLLSSALLSRYFPYQKTLGWEAFIRGGEFNRNFTVFYIGSEE